MIIKTIIFLIASITILNTIAFFIPKKLTKIEIYSTGIFALMFAAITDTILDIKYDLYGYFGKGPDLIALAFLSFIGLYPTANLIILNYYPFQKSILTKSIYTIIVTVCCVSFEYVSIKARYFYHNKWNLWYSALGYIIIINMLAWNFSIIRRMLESQYNKK